MEVSEIKKAENNRNVSNSATTMDNEEKETGLIQEASEPKEDKSTRFIALEGDKAGNNIDFVRDIKGSTRENSLRLTFTCKRSHNLSDPVNDTQESRETGYEKNRRSRAICGVRMSVRKERLKRQLTMDYMVMVSPKAVETVMKTVMNK